MANDVDRVLLTGDDIRRVLTRISHEILEQNRGAGALVPGAVERFKEIDAEKLANPPDPAWPTYTPRYTPRDTPRDTPQIAISPDATWQVQVR